MRSYASLIAPPRPSRTGNAGLKSMEAANSQLGIGNLATLGGTPSAMPSPTAPVSSTWQLPPNRAFGAPPAFEPAELRTGSYQSGGAPLLAHPWPTAPAGAVHGWYGYGGAGSPGGATATGVGQVYPGASSGGEAGFQRAMSPEFAVSAPPPPPSKREVFAQQNPTLARLLG